MVIETFETIGGVLPSTSKPPKHSPRRAHALSFQTLEVRGCALRLTITTQPSHTVLSTAALAQSQITIADGQGLWRLTCGCRQLFAAAVYTGDITGHGARATCAGAIATAAMGTTRRHMTTRVADDIHRG